MSSSHDQFHAVAGRFDRDQITVRVAGDAHPRFAVDADGTVRTGDGTAAPVPVETGGSGGLTQPQVQALIDSTVAGLGLGSAAQADVGEDPGDVPTVALVDGRIAAVVGAAPEALDTLEEIADRLADDADAVAAIANLLSDLSGDVQALDGRVEDVEGDVGALDTRVGAVEGAVVAADAKADAAQSDVDALDARVVALEEAEPGEGGGASTAAQVSYQEGETAEATAPRLELIPTVEFPFTLTSPEHITFQVMRGVTVDEVETSTTPPGGTFSLLTPSSRTFNTLDDMVDALNTLASGTDTAADLYGVRFAAEDGKLVIYGTAVPARGSSMLSGAYASGADGSHQWLRVRGIGGAGAEYDLYELLGLPAGGAWTEKAYGTDANSATVADALGHLTGQTTLLDAQVSANSARVTSNTNSITSLDSRVSSVENRATSLEGRATAAEGRLDALENADPGGGVVASILGPSMRNGDSAANDIDAPADTRHAVGDHTLITARLEVTEALGSYQLANRIDIEEGVNDSFVAGVWYAGSYSPGAPFSFAQTITVAPGTYYYVEELRAALEDAVRATMVPSTVRIDLSEDGEALRIWHTHEQHSFGFEAVEGNAGLETFGFTEGLAWLEEDSLTGVTSAPFEVSDRSSVGTNLEVDLYADHTPEESHTNPLNEGDPLETLVFVPGFDKTGELLQKTLMVDAPRLVARVRAKSGDTFVGHVRLYCR